MRIGPISLRLSKKADSQPPPIISRGRVAPANHTPPSALPSRPRRPGQSYPSARSAAASHPPPPPQGRSFFPPHARAAGTEAGCGLVGGGWQGGCSKGSAICLLFVSYLFAICSQIQIQSQINSSPPPNPKLHPPSPPPSPGLPAGCPSPLLKQGRDSRRRPTRECVEMANNTPPAALPPPPLL